MGHGLNKIGLRFRYHCTTKIKKVCPHSEKRTEGRLVQIEETYQEEVFQEGTLQGEASQEVMAASIDDATA